VEKSFPWCGKIARKFSMAWKIRGMDFERDCRAGGRVIGVIQIGH
jgi:hypothetical protein